MLQCWPIWQAAHIIPAVVPPQSTSVSAPSWTPLLQLTDTAASTERDDD
jgi:hypothetical protein